MATFKIKESDYTTTKKGEKIFRIIRKEKFDSFNQDILGLGKIETKSEQVQALSVIFDLEGFTNFCKQIDPQLAVPEYLSEFLKWLFDEIKNSLREETFENGYRLYSTLPFLSKYLGDGVLFLWNTENMNETQIQNVVIAMYNICTKYTKNFLPKISKNVSSPPIKLRCGIARGTAYSVGNGYDFVGPCINMSARLQKLHSLSFCFSRRGIAIESMAEASKKTFLVKKVDIRGIGSDELVVVVASEYNKLSKEDKERFKEI